MRSFPAVWTCVCVIAAATCAAQPLADRLPAETLVYGGWAGTQTLQFDGSLFGQMLKDPALAEAAAALQRAFAQDGSNGRQVVVRNALDLAAIAWKRPCAIAWLDLQLGGRSPEPVAVLLIDLGEQREAFAAALDPLVEALGKDLPVTGVTGGPRPYRVARLKDGPELSFGYMGEVFFLTLGAQAPQRLFAVTAETSLDADPRFRKHMDAVGGPDEQVGFYADIAAIRLRVEMLAAMALASQGGPAPQVLLEALGLNKATCLAGTIRIVDKHMYSRARLFSPAPHRGLLLPLAGPALSAADLSSIPADAVYFAAAKISPAAAFRELRRALETISPGLDRRFTASVERLETHLDLSLTEDVLGALGDTWLVSSAPSHGGLLTGTLLSVNVRDPEAFAATLEKIEGFAADELPREARLESLPTGRTRVRYLAFPGAPMPLAPAWALSRGRLYIGGWPQVVQSAVLREAVPGLTNTPAFEPWRARVAEKASILGYVDLPALLRHTYQWILLAWTSAANALPQGVPVESRPAWLPPLARLELYLSPQITAVSADNDGIIFERFGSLPFGAALGGQGAAAPATAISVLLPALSRARHQARRAVSSANLSELGKAAMLYSSEHQQMPQSLADLVPYLGGTKTLVSPISGRQPPQFVDGKLRGEVDYILMKLPDWAELEHPVRVILAYERPENDEAGTNVVFADGHVEWMSGPQFRQAMRFTQQVIQDAQNEAPF